MSFAPTTTKDLRNYGYHYCSNSRFDIDWNYWAAESIDLRSAQATTYGLKNYESLCDS